MKYRRIIIITTVILVGFALAEAQIAWDPEKFMPLEEIKPGMQGKCYTVFFGTTVEPFEFEVISIEYDALPDWDIIWVKCSGENIEKTGVASGMSGSPAYIDGRLIGALAAGYSSQRKDSNIFGMTSIELMIQVTQRGMTPNLSYQGHQLLNLESNWVSQTAEILPFGNTPITNRKATNFLDVPLSNAKPSELKTPVAISGINLRMLDLLKPVFEKYKMLPLQAAAGNGSVKSAPIEEGQIIGTEIVRGDFSVFGFGTITYIDENKQLLAYGHSSLGEGHVNLPMSGGYVHYIHPNTTMPFKVASPTQPIGAIVQDRQGAIAGLIGDSPSYIPITAKIMTTNGKIYQKKYEVIRHRDFSAMYSQLGIWYIIDALESEFGDHQAKVNTTINLVDQPGLEIREISHHNIFSSGISPGFSTIQSLRPLINLIGNPYQKVEIESVTIDVEFEDKRSNAVIEGIRIQKDEFRPGETINVAIVIRPYLENPIVQKAQITIPQDTPEGQVTLLVSSGASYENWQRQRAPLNYRPKNINQFVKLLQRGESSSDLIVELFIPKFGMTVQGEEFPEPPVSMLSVMNSQTQSGEGGYTRGRTLHTEKTSTGYVLAGSRFLRIMVNRSAQ